MSSSTDTALVLARLQSTLAALEGLRQQVGLPAAVAAVKGRPVGASPGITPANLPAVVSALHGAFIGQSISNIDQVSKTILRPVSPNAIWVDQPSSVSTSIGTRGGGPAAWKQAFPDYAETVLNVIGNERYFTVEVKGTGTHTGPLNVGGQTIAPTKRPFEIKSANVITLDGGSAVRFEHYYDLSTMFRQLGMLPDIPMGHDEPVKGAGKIPPLMHPAGGFLGGSPDTWPILVGPPPAPGRYNVSIGNSTTKQAQKNIANCQGIHAAFVNHTPIRFDDYIAGD
jgi:hypothetical protein